MSFYGSNKITKINRSTEDQLEEELRRRELAHDGMIRLVSVYKSGSGYTAWYYHDYKKAGAPPVEKKKKVTKKKATKKAN